MTSPGRIQKSFEYELKQLKAAVMKLEPLVAIDAVGPKLKSVCHQSRALYASVEEWILLEEKLPETQRQMAIKAHDDASAVIAKIDVPKELDYVPETIAKRKRKLETIDKDSVSRELSDYLSKIA